MWEPKTNCNTYVFLHFCTRLTFNYNITEVGQNRNIRNLIFFFFFFFFMFDDHELACLSLSLIHSVYMTIALLFVFYVLEPLLTAPGMTSKA